MSAPPSLRSAWSSTIALKVAMAVSGLGMVGFVLVHLLGNLQVFLGPDALNTYAAKLKGLGPLLWVMRIGLIVVFVVHVALALRLAAENKAARPERYAHPGRVHSSWASAMCHVPPGK